MDGTSVTLPDVQAALNRLSGVARVTPCLGASYLDRVTGSQVTLKAECLQRSGSFKFRGAYNALAAMDVAARQRGVVAYSSGNHGQAVALAAREWGVPAVILMPADAPVAKVLAARGYGAEVLHYDRQNEDRVLLAEAAAAERGMHVLPSSDHPAVIAGQGTVALELLERSPSPDVLVVPVGGGGLLAGSAVVLSALSPGTRLIGVQPEGCDATRRSLQAGRRVSVPISATVADGLQLQAPSAMCFDIFHPVVEEVIVVNDAEILRAMALLAERLKLVVEPSGAAALAAVLAGRVGDGHRVTAVLTGGNVGVRRLAGLLAAAAESG